MLSHSQTIPISGLEVKSLTIPTDFPESGGTLEWDRTTIVPIPRDTDYSSVIRSDVPIVAQHTRLRY